MIELRFFIEKMSTPTIEHILSSLEIYPTVPVRIEFNTTEDLMLYASSLRLAQALESRPGDTTAIAIGGLFGTQLAPFLACKTRLISSETIVVIEPVAHPVDKAKERLCRHIMNIESGPYFTADKYHDMSALFAASYKRMSEADADLLARIRHTTSIPESVLTRFSSGIVLDSIEATEWCVATERLA